MLDCSVKGSVATITLNRPPVNALDEAMLTLLDRALTEVEGLPSVKVLLFVAEGKCFCAGADIDMLRHWTEGERGQLEWDSFTSRLQETFNRIANLQIPTISAIHGAATGGGLELALATDLRVVANEASIGLPEIRLGVVPGAGGTQRLTQLVGRNVALRMLLRGEIIKGDAATQLGLAEFSVPRAEVRERAIDLAAELANWPKAALVANKACVLAFGGAGYERELEYTRALARSNETRELIKAFFTK